MKISKSQCCTNCICVFENVHPKCQQQPEPIFIFIFWSDLILNIGWLIDWLKCTNYDIKKMIKEREREREREREWWIAKKMMMCLMCFKQYSIFFVWQVSSSSPRWSFSFSLLPVFITSWLWWWWWWCPSLSCLV